MEDIKKAIFVIRHLVNTVENRLEEHDIEYEKEGDPITKIRRLLDVIAEQAEPPVMTITEWNEAMDKLTENFQFARDVPALEKLVEAAKTIESERERTGKYAY